MFSSGIIDPFKVTKVFMPMKKLDLEAIRKAGE
jgi:hypothetical protein